MHAFLEPAELPTDLETITDEERFLFRKIGLSMKPYLLLGNGLPQMICFYLCNKDTSISKNICGVQHLYWTHSDIWGNNHILVFCSVYISIYILVGYFLLKVDLKIVILKSKFFGLKIVFLKRKFCIL